MRRLDLTQLQLVRFCMLYQEYLMAVLRAMLRTLTLLELTSLRFPGLFLARCSRFHGQNTGRGHLPKLLRESVLSLATASLRALRSVVSLRSASTSKRVSW